jgi:hypothetical protein
MFFYTVKRLKPKPNPHLFHRSLWRGRPCTIVRYPRHLEAFQPCCILGIGFVTHGKVPNHSVRTVAVAARSPTVSYQQTPLVGSHRPNEPLIDSPTRHSRVSVAVALKEAFSPTGANTPSTTSPSSINLDSRIRFYLQNKMPTRNTRVWALKIFQLR